MANSEGKWSTAVFKLRYNVYRYNVTLSTFFNYASEKALITGAHHPCEYSMLLTFA
jgi:hypothetical protein